MLTQYSSCSVIVLSPSFAVFEVVAYHVIDFQHLADCEKPNFQCLVWIWRVAGGQMIVWALVMHDELVLVLEAAAFYADWTCAAVRACDVSDFPMLSVEHSWTPLSYSVFLD